MTLNARQDRFESYEVYDDEGNSVGRIVLPRRTPSFGQTEGTVYLRRAPNLREPSRSHAA